MLDSDEEEERAGEKEALCKRRKNVLRNKKKSSNSKNLQEKKFELKSSLRMISSQEIESHTFVRFVTHNFSAKKKKWGSEYTMAKTKKEKGKRQRITKTVKKKK